MTDEFAFLDLTLVASSLTNPRKTFNPTRLAELAESIKASGVHQPILVRPLPGSRVADTDRKVAYEIVSGERRYRASQMAGAATIPALIRTLTDDQVLECQLVENLQRDDLTELEEAEGYQALMAHSNLTADEVGAKIGKSRSYVYGRLKLLDACTEVRTALRDGTIDASRALLLARIPDPKLQIKALDEIAQTYLSGDLEMGYRAAAAYIQREYMLHLDKARFKITDESLLPEAGSCKACPKRTGANPDLFADVKAADVCTDPDCYRRKEDAHTTQTLRVAHERGQTVIEGREAKALMPNSWGGIDGYLRLDNNHDSPTDQPLRTLLGKQLDDVQPVLIANPHKEGDLIAVLPSATVAELLKAKGHTDSTDAAAKISKDIAAERRHEAEKAKAQFKEDFERGWRAKLVERTWQAIQNDGEERSLSDAVLRYLAMGYAGRFNSDKCQKACTLLGLGKVAPGQGLKDYIADTEAPQDVLMLLIMLSDMEYRPWLKDDGNGNEGMYLITEAYESIDLLAIKAECKKEIEAKVKKPKTAAKKSTSTPTPAALQTKVAGGDAKARAPKKKLSAEQAKSGIAAAMQSQEQAQTAAPEAPAALPDPDHGFAIGLQVRVTTDPNKLGTIAKKFAGKEGKITKREVGGGYWYVAVRGKGVSVFAEDQIEVMA